MLGLHAMFYTDKPDEMRAFLRDVLGYPHFDAGGGWLIFQPADSEIGCHPHDGKPFHELSFYTKDVEATMKELQARGVAFTRPVEDHGYGLVTYFKAPDGSEIQLYQPKYR